MASLAKVGSNPYVSAGPLDRVSRWIHLKDPQKVKTCALSGRKIEVPGRVFTVEQGNDKKHYDIYCLVISIIEKREFNYPNESLKRFMKQFKFDPIRFKGLWGDDRSAFLAWDMSHNLIYGDIPVHGEQALAGARLNLFAEGISRARRYSLRQYSDEVLPEAELKEFASQRDD